MAGANSFVWREELQGEVHALANSADAIITCPECGAATKRGETFEHVMACMLIARGIARKQGKAKITLDTPPPEAEELV